MNETSKTDARKAIGFSHWQVWEMNEALRANYEYIFIPFMPNKIE